MSDLRRHVEDAVLAAMSEPPPLRCPGRSRRWFPMVVMRLSRDSRPGRPVTFLGRFSASAVAEAAIREVLAELARPPEQVIGYGHEIVPRPSPGYVRRIADYHGVTLPDQPEEPGA
jgi:hypothetical protein